MLENKENEKGNLNNPIFIYFIEVHDKSRSFEYNLKNNSGIKSPYSEILEGKDFRYKATEFNYIYKVYRINYFLEKEKFEISIQFKEEDEKGNIYESKITNENKLKSTSHIFLYNFEPIDQNRNTYFSKNSSNEYPLSYYAQFKIYLNIIKEKYKDKKSQEYQDCINYILNTLKSIKYDFILYISVFAECFDSKNINLLLKLFDTDKELIKLGEFNNESLAYYKEVINKIVKNPNIVLDQISSENQKAKITLYTIILIFDLKFQKEKLKDITWDENFIHSILLNYNHFLKLFDYNTIKDVLSLTKDCYIILFILDTNKEYILDKFNEEKKIVEKKREKDKEKDLIIQVDKYIVLKEEEEKLDKELNFIESLIEFQKRKKIQFISFSCNFLDLMSKLINEKNIELIFSFKKALKSVKSFETSLKYSKIDIDKILDKIISISIKNKSFSLFKSKCEDLVNYLYKHDKYLDDYAIYLIEKNEKDEEFFKNRKEKNIKHNKDFIVKAINVVTSLDQFDLLLEILCEGKESKDFLKNSLISIQETFINKISQYTNEKLKEYIDIISKLINKSIAILEEDKVEIFLKKLENNLNKEFIVNLYISILNKYPKINLHIKIKIKNFLEKLDPDNIVTLIKNLNENNIDFIRKNLKQYIIKEKEFFKIEEESTSLKILKSLIGSGLMPKKDSSNIFLKETYNALESIRNSIYKYDFTFQSLSQFFQESNREIFSERISLLYLIDNKDMVKDVIQKNNNNKNFELIQQQLKNKYEEIKKFIDSLVSIRDYLTHFISYQNHKDLEEIYKLIYYFEGKCAINNFDKEKPKIEKYEKIYRQKVKKRLKFSESKLFMNIKLNETKLYQDDEKIIEQSFTKFKKAGEIFNKDSFDYINEEILSIYLNIYSKNKDNINEELNKIKDLLDIKNQSNSNKKIIDTLDLFSKKDLVIKTAEAVINLIVQTEVVQKEYSRTLNSIIEYKEHTYIRDFLEISIKILKVLGIDLDIKENYFINILLHLNKKPEVIKFLLKKSVEECGLLYDSLDNNDFLKISDIIDLEKCVEYMNYLGNIEEIKQMKDSELIEKAKSSNLICKNLEINFENFIEHFDDIKEIIKEKFDKSEASRQKIKYICQHSTFGLSTIEKNFFVGNYYIKDEEKKDNIINKKISLNELQELRDRAILTINPLGETKENKKFIDMVSYILKVHNLLEEIYNSGYTKILTIKISSKEYIQSFLLTLTGNYNDRSENKENILSILKNIINNSKDNFIKGYKNKKLKFIRFIYGRQFNIIYDYLHNNKENISSFLKFISNQELENYKTNYKWYEDKNKNEFQNIVVNCNDFIDNVLKENKISLDKIYNKTLIKKKPKLEADQYKGFYVYSCNKLEKEIIQLYIFLTENIPIAQNILLCNRQTSKEEITSFLYRAILCDFNSCFVIGGIESLKFNQKNYFIEILNQILNDVQGNFESCLIIFSSVKSSDIFKSLDSIQYKKAFNSSIEKNIEKIKIENLDKITIVNSDKAGIGKSTKIKNIIEEKRKHYIYFPLGGVFTRKDILQRLKQLNIGKNTAIHLDLYDTDCIDLMMEFLFWIIIGNLYKKKEDIFYLFEDTEIYIEIPNGFINFFRKFPILDLIPQKPGNKLLINQLEPLIVPKELDSKVQIVSNYLKLFNQEKIDENDLNIPGIITDLSKNFNNKKLINAQELSQNECQDLIFETFKKYNENVKNFNYYQIDSFINVLADEFIKFNQNIHIKTLLLFKSVNIRHLRTLIFEGFIQHSNYFTQGAFTKLINEQKITHKMLFGQYDENEDNRKGINDLAKDKHFTISFDKIDPSLIFFHDGENPLFSYITNKKETDLEYKAFLCFFNCQTNEHIKSFPDYKNEKFNFLPQLKIIFDLNNPLTTEEKTQDQIKEGIKSLEEIANDYVFTSDNFIKMILILLRLRANIPVIMMGETGCGKTALIKKLSELKNSGDCDRMKILNIHAGTTDNDIIKFIEKIMPEAKSLELKDNEIIKERSELGMLYERKKIWVFLDEINTCKSMGLISELMCKHTYQGKPVNSNIAFIGACNPYREVIKKEEKTGLEINQAQYNFGNLDEKSIIQIKKSAFSSNSKLVYRVNPLPHSLLNFVYDFASLEEKDEKKYILKIIEPSLKKILKNYKDDSEENKEIIDLAKNMIFEAQKFIRDNYDMSSVSLREVKRYNILFEFFFNYLKNKKQNFSNFVKNDNTLKFEYDKLKDFDLQKYAINLAIYICYYIRISNKNLREKFVEKINEIFKYNNFLDLPLLEMKFITDNIEIPEGIARNKALSENIFSLFCAINARIPLFIVGKPGCSKSLSVQLIFKSMKGESSKNEFFKKLPKLVIFSYQGSLTSTSEGVETIFKKANNAMDKFKAEKKENISMIFFDEMGLAEHSPNNPLKVIHSQLEIDSDSTHSQLKIELDNNHSQMKINPDKKEKSKAAFVGISNWVLDAAKMNRGLHISIPELDEEDIINTSKTIADSYNKELVSKFEKFFINLGETYYKYKLYLKENHNLDGKEDFHGNRDFFHFIKYASQKISKKINTINENDLPLIGLKSIERNFAGLKFDEKDSVKIVKGIFKDLCKYNNNDIGEYDSIKNIKENKNEKNSRYLLLISNSSESCNLLSSILEEDDYIFIIGSQFIEDSNSEEYQLKVIKKIQIYMEEGKTVILKDLESVYPALYDLFNQNFTIMNGKNFARISIGSSFSIYSQVNTKFKCIVNVDINNISKQEPPFLNRFEKHIVTYENLLDENLTNISNKIFDDFIKIIDSKKEFK